MRENGLGDVSVSKNMKILINQFYNILLNSEKFKSFNNKEKIDFSCKRLIKDFYLAYLKYTLIFLVKI